MDDLVGKVVTGRNVPGYQTSSKEGGIRIYGQPLTDVERMQQHYARYGTTDLPPRGTGLEGNPGRAGVPLTETERMQQHYARYGTTALPPRGTGLGGNPGRAGVLGQQRLGPDFGSFVAGAVIGFIIGGLLLTGVGREIGYRAAKRVARKI